MGLRIHAVEMLDTLDADISVVFMYGAIMD